MTHDKTDQQARKALTELQAAIDSIGIGLIATDAAGRISHMNIAAESLTGWGKSESVGKLLNEVFCTINDPTGDEIENPAKRVLREAKAVDLASPTQIIARSGAKRYVSGSCSPICNEQNEITGAALTFRAQAIEHGTKIAPQESQELYKTIADHTNDWVYWQAPDGHLSYISPSCERITGYRGQEFLENSLLLHAIIHPDDQNAFQQHRQSKICRGAFANAIQQESGETIFRIIRKDGETRWIGHVCQAVRDADGTPLGLRVSNRDITARKHAEEALKESEERLRLALDAANQGLFDLDFSSGKAVASPQYFKVLGYDAKEVELSIDWWRKVLHPEDIDSAIATLQSCMDGKISNYETKYRILAKDGKWKWIQSIGEVVKYDANNKPLRLIGIHCDVTEKMQAEKKRLSNLRFMEKIEQVDRIIRQVDNLEEMMTDVLDAVLSIYESDRAWLLYPCDPDAPSWSIPMERTRKEYPGAFSRQMVIPTLPEVKEAFQTALAADNPVVYHPQHGLPLPPQTTEEFSVRSEIDMAVRPKLGKPWLFGTHQCSHARIWTDEETRLFKEIGRRIADALSNLLLLRNLQESERSYRTLAENLPGIVYRRFLAGKHRLQFFNNMVEPITGFSADELMAAETCPMEAIMLPEDREHAILEKKRAIDANEVFDIEYRLQRKDGAIICCSQRGRVITGTDGKPLYIDSVIFDVTKRKQAEAALNRRLELEKIISSVSSDFINIGPEAFDSGINDALRKVGRFASVDRSYMFMASEDGVYCSNTHEWRQEGIEPQIENLQNIPITALPWWMERLKRLEPIHIPRVSDLPHEAGAEKELLESQDIQSLIVIPLVSAGSLIGFLGFDSVTEEKDWADEDVLLLKMLGEVIVNALRRLKAEQALRESEQKHRLLADSAEDVIWLMGLDLVFQYASPAAFRMVGRTPEEMQGSSLKDICDAANFAKISTIVQQALGKLPSTDGIRLEAEILHKDGRSAPVEIIGKVLVDKTGNPVLLQGITRDITERKEAEKALDFERRQLLSIFDSIDQIIYIADPSSHEVLYANKHAKKILGRDPTGSLCYKEFQGVDAPCAFCTNDIILKNKTAPYIWEHHNQSMNIDLEIVDRIIKWPDGRDVRFELALDITERKRAEKESRDMLHFLQTLIDTIPSSLFYKDAEGIYRGCNKAYETFLGKRKEEIVGKSVYDVFPKELADEYHKMDSELFQRPGKQAYESKLLAGDGVRHDVIFNKATFLNMDGSIGGIVGVAVDISERKKLELELQSARQQLADIIDFLPDATFAVDRTGKIIAWNRAIEDMTGVKAEHVLGKGDFEYALPFYGIRRPALIDLVFGKDEGLEKKYFFVKKMGDIFLAEIDVLIQGKTRALSAKAGPLYDSEGNIVGAIESMRDITERRRAEEELQRLASIVRHTREAVYLADTNGKMLFLNDAGIEMLGIGQKEVEQTHISHTLPDHLHEKWRSELMPALAQNGVWEGELQYRNLKTGKLSDVHALAFTIADPRTGAPLYLANVALDISERKRTEKEKDQLKARLQQAYKMEAIGTLAGGIAHDFNNILSAVIGYSELAQSLVEPKDRVRRHLDQILQAGYRARDLVKQILAFSRQSDQEQKPLSIGPLIKEVTKFIRASIPTTIEIKTEILVKSDLILGNPTQMHQVLMNLCTNAEYAMREKGNLLYIKLVEMDLDAQFIASHPDLHEGAYLMLTVSDNGHGMSREIIERIFDPFFTTKVRGEGTGMGLAVVHGIVKNHGGAITVYSEPGKGSTFNIYLPRLEAAQREESHQEAVPIPMGKERVLVVDDEPLLANLLKSMLARLGYDVVAITSSLEALDLFRSAPDRFDIVITDQTMPAMAGGELAKELMRIRPDIPVVLCTGFSHRISQEQAKAIGIREFLMKPIITRNLVEAIRRAVGG